GTIVHLYGSDGGKDPPVPIPNTAVKLPSAEDSEGFPFVKAGRCRADHSAIAQSVERVTVNHDVAGSSPACGVYFFVFLPRQFAALAQQVERFHGKEEVIGSNPI